MAPQRFPANSRVSGQLRTKSDVMWAFGVEAAQLSVLSLSFFSVQLTPYRRAITAGAETMIGAMLLQLGVRGAVLQLNEQHGNAFDVSGSQNGSRFFWMLIPESDSIDVVVRSAIVPLLIAGVFMLVHALLRLRPSRSAATTVFSRIGRGALGVYLMWLGVWGAIVVISKGAISWEPSEVIFPEMLYLVIHEIWFLLIVAGFALCADTYRRVWSRRSGA